MEEKKIAQDGLRLKEFRKFKKISQKELADLLGCSQPNLSKIENGELGVSKSLSERLFNEYLDLNPNWLLFGGGKMLQRTTDEPMISIDLDKGYIGDDFDKIEAQYREFQDLIDQGKIPLTAISLMFRNMRELLAAQQELLEQYKKKELKRKLENLDKPLKIR